MSNFFYDEASPVIDLPDGKTHRKILAHNDNVMIVKVIFDKGSVGEVHTHPHTQATYCLEGEFEFTIGEEKKTIKEGDTLVMPSDIAHGCRVLTESGILLDIFTPERKDFL
ncbi:MAG: cupin domain-containing protein [Clostridiales bacterium]|nr:cupin domain-containing protein [Clostridiales bacterium]MCD8214096.1 cupin domain-containing protein [Clostridiales bacterium]